MKLLERTALFSVALLALAACASTTTFTSTWKAPDAQPLDPRGHKVAAVFISTDESSRRVAEDVLVRKLDERGAQGIASYTLIPTAAVSDFDSVKKQLADAGVDGVVVMRVIDQRQKITVRNDAPFFGYPPYYWRFSGYWGYGWGAPYAPTEVSSTTVLSIESLVYSLTRDTLIWAGTSRTTDPGNVEKLVNEVADAAAKQMTKQGLLPKQA
ncbi:MAG TPA: hypothetical protein VG994_16435 [Steroidobacteraceae bacterium]|nr:hypothetical protein [Steroidobacteraceae bacterium]